MSAGPMTRGAAALTLAALLALAAGAPGADAAKGARAKSAKARPAPAAARAESTTVLVRIGDQAITEADFAKRLEEIPEQMRAQFGSAEGKQQLLQRMVEERVWLITALRNGVAERAKVKQQLEQQRRDLLIRTYLNELMAGSPQPADSAAKAYYDAHATDYKVPATVTVRHIQTRTEAEARAVLKLARAGQDWTKLVQKYSADTLTRSQGGLLGTVTREGMFPALGRQPALAESAFALGAGRIGGPYHGEKGWHVLKVDEIKPESQRPLDAVRPMIMRQLGSQATQDYYRLQLEEAQRKLNVTPDSAAIKGFVSAKKDPKEIFKAAQELGPPADRIAAYQELLKEYPESEVSPQAQFMIGFIYSEELKNYDQAEKAFRELLKRYPRSELATSAQWMVEHMRSDEAPPFRISEGDSGSVDVPKGAAGKSPTGKP